MLYRFI
ncbi:hypothetical protein RLOC_00012035 [Lonchura striata]|nr:hypothetical protein RLOC_00012035 [Lonchura striata domestica]